MATSLNYKLFCSMHKSNCLVQLLKALHFKESAVIHVTRYGMKVTVVNARSVQASAFFQKELFDEFALSDDIPITFMINLTILLQCLSILFGRNTSMLKICYEGYGHPLLLLLQEDGVLTECKIKTFEAENVVDFDFSSAKITNKIVIKSEYLKEAFSDLDCSSEFLEVSMSPKNPVLKLTTRGIAGDFHVEYPNRSEVIESIECSKSSLTKYRVALLKPSLKPLIISEKVSIRTDDNEVVCFQYLIKLEDEQNAFIEYFCLPAVDEDEDSFE